MVMAGQELEEEEAARVEKVSTGSGGPDPESTLDQDPDPELKPTWTFDGKGLIRFDFGD